jgi:uncharacterized protein (DUF433 family)
MKTQAEYRHLVERPDKRSTELFIREAGIRASTVWHDRYVSRQHPDRIAKDRELPLAAVYEALVYCQENWERIYTEKDQERVQLGKSGFFDEQPKHT